LEFPAFIYLPAAMNLQKMISELRAEKTRLDDAILALERLSVAHPKKRGRPLQWDKEQLTTTSDTSAAVAEVESATA
jgi:hypothetical protein